MTTAHPPESRSADSTAVSDEGQAPPLVHEMAPGQRFPSPNQVDMERGPFWRAGLLPESPWEAHPVTIIANLGEPIGESRVTTIGGVGVPYTVASAAVKKVRSLGLARRSRKAPPHSRRAIKSGPCSIATTILAMTPQSCFVIKPVSESRVPIHALRCGSFFMSRTTTNPTGAALYRFTFKSFDRNMIPGVRRCQTVRKFTERVEAAEKRSEAQLARRVAGFTPMVRPLPTVGKLTRAIRSAALEANLVKPAKA